MHLIFARKSGRPSAEKAYFPFPQWPEYEESKTVEDSIEIGVQVNGKVRGTIVIPNGCAKEEALELAKKDERVASFLEGKTLVKEIYVPNKIVNFVAK